MKRLIIDTDPGVDDAHAILLALAHPDVQVEAITTVNRTWACCTTKRRPCVRICSVRSCASP